MDSPLPDSSSASPSTSDVTISSEAENNANIPNLNISSFKQSENHEDFIKRLSNKFRNSVEIQDRTYRFKSYKSCFVGSEAVTWLITESAQILSREDAVAAGQAMMALDFLNPDFISLNDIVPVSLSALQTTSSKNSKSIELMKQVDKMGLDTTPGAIDIPYPQDAYNKELFSLCHPSDWKSPKVKSRYNLVVIGAGAAGLVTAAGAAGLGAAVAIIDKSLFGGDCLNTGCVPSKALLAAGRRFQEIKNSHEYGISGVDGVTIDFGKVMTRMRKIRSHIAHHDSVQRFTELGCDVFLGHARFLGKDRVSVNGQTLYFSRAVIASGGSPTCPPIPGLKDVGYVTNESIFNLTELPKRLAIIGTGPIGCELAQAFSSFGSQVTLFGRSKTIMKREDPDAAKIIQAQMEKEGVTLTLGVAYKLISISEDKSKLITFVQGDSEKKAGFDLILVATGRAPNVSGLSLEKAGIEFDLKSGIKVNDFLQTSNSNVYACGDCVGLDLFTHACNHQARIVIRNSLFFGFARVSSLLMPWVTYTHPEVAHVGLYEKDIEGCQVFTKDFSELDRALCEGSDYTSGFVRVYTAPGKDQILGATVVCPGAGELIGEFAVAMRGNVGLKTLSTVIHPYPTIGESIPMLGDLFNRTKLTPTAAKALNSILAFRR